MEIIPTTREDHSKTRAFGWNGIVYDHVCVCVITKSLKNRLRTVQLLFRETLYPRLSLFLADLHASATSSRGLFLGPISPPRILFLRRDTASFLARSLAPARVTSCLVTFAMKIDRFVSIFVSVPFSRHTTRRSVENTKTYYGGNIRECVCKCANV